MSNQIHIDELDRKILSILLKNARVPFLEVARECNVSGAAIHQRINRLTEAGIILGSELILDPAKIGYSTCAYIGIFLEKARMNSYVINELKKIPEIVECHYTTGGYAIFAKLFARNNDHLKYILMDRIQSIDGITSTETLISLEQSFKRELVIPVEK